MKEYMLTVAAIGGDAPRRVIAENEDGRTVAMLVPDLHASDAAAVAAARRLRVGKTPHIDLYRIEVEDDSRLIGDGRVKGTSSSTHAGGGGADEHSCRSSQPASRMRAGEARRGTRRRPATRAPAPW